MLGSVGGSVIRKTRQCHRQFSSKTSIFGSSSFWSDLRQKAATVITSSLSETEREALLSKYNPTTPKENDGVTTAATPAAPTNMVDQETMAKSISEAVAEARAKEAAQQTEKWSKEMESHQQKMEEAARARVEKDLILQQRKLRFEQWQRELDQAKTQTETQTQANSDTAAAVNAKKEDDAIVESTSMAITQQQEATVIEDDYHHGLLGPCLADLGSKRLHLVAADILADLPVWKRQRTFRLDRAKVMAKEKSKSLHLGIPGIIGLVQDQDGSLSIIDGQHRVGMMKLLAETAADIDLSRILVEVYTTTSTPADKDDFARELFVEINKAEPVKLVDMPGVAKEADRRVLTEAAENLVEQYPDMFSASQRCRAPHLNMDNLRDALFSSGILKKHDLKSSKALIKWLLDKNEALATKYQNDSGDVPPKALEKAQKFQFYLGLESGWMYE